MRLGNKITSEIMYFHLRRKIFYDSFYNTFFFNQAESPYVMLYIGGTNSLVRNKV